MKLTEPINEVKKMCNLETTDVEARNLYIHTVHDSDNILLDQKVLGFYTDDTKALMDFLERVKNDTRTVVHHLVYRCTEDRVLRNRAMVDTTQLAAYQQKKLANDLAVIDAEEDR
jgi:hypothetical protein